MVRSAFKGLSGPNFALDYYSTVREGLARAHCQRRSQLAQQIAAVPLQPQ